MTSQLPRTSVRVTAILFCLALWVSAIGAQRIGDAQLVHEWTSLDFDWPSQAMKELAMFGSGYVPERNIACTVRVYKNDVFLAIPRWRWNYGHPATLVKVVQVRGKTKLRPYPDWATQTQGDCKNFQFVQSMEIDPNTGLMYAIDTGRTGIFGAVGPKNLCPAKIIVIDLNSDTVVEIHELSEDHVSRSRNFINDIVLDYVEGQVRYAYISDTTEGKLYAYDFASRTTVSLDHESMKPESGNATVININGKNYTYEAGINGIAMSYDFNYVYYCDLGGFNLYQIPISTLRNLVNGNINSLTEAELGIRSVGRKISQSDAIVYGKKRLYFGALGLNAVYFWDVERDAQAQNVPLNRVEMRTQVELVRNDDQMQWPDSFTFDGSGWLWFLSSRMFLFKTNQMDFSGADGSNVRVWKIFVNETGYLDDADSRTKGY